LQSLAVDLAGIAKGRHVLAWSSDANLEAVWDAVGAGGGLQPDGVMVSVENYDGDKLDYYIEPRADLELDRNRDGTWAAQLAVTITNAPRSPTSPYIEGFHPERHFVFLDVHLPLEAAEISLEGDGLTFADHGTDSPMIAAVMIYYIKSGESKTVSIDFTMPAQMDRLTLLPSARLKPVMFTVNGTNAITDATPSSFALRARPLDYSADPYLLFAALMGVGAAGFGLSASLAATRLDRGNENTRAVKRVRFDRHAATVLSVFALTALAVALARLIL
jgi:hypothetical protein